MSGYDYMVYKCRDNTWSAVIANSATPIQVVKEFHGVSNSQNAHRKAQAWIEENTK